MHAHASGTMRVKDLFFVQQVHLSAWCALGVWMLKGKACRGILEARLEDKESRQWYGFVGDMEWCARCPNLGQASEVQHS